jgi:hypothetical protein
VKQKFSFHFIVNAAATAALAFTLILPKTSQADFLLPNTIRDNVEIISTFDSKQVVIPTEKAKYVEQQYVYTNLIGNALKSEGNGGVYEGKVLKVKKTFPIYRVYTKKENPQTGRNNRFGGWWTHVPPGKGVSKSDYRRRYEICESFNHDLDQVEQCWIFPGALLLIGPGQSVSEDTCGKPGESYASDTGKENLQIYIFEMFKHNFLSQNEQTPLKDIEQYIGCPAESDDRSFDWYSEGKAPSN